MWILNYNFCICTKFYTLILVNVNCELTEYNLINNIPKLSLESAGLIKCNFKSLQMLICNELLSTGRNIEDKKKTTWKTKVPVWHEYCNWHAWLGHKKKTG